MRVFTEKDVVNLLRAEVTRAGSQLAWARKARVDRVMVNKILKVKRHLPGQLSADSNSKLFMYPKLSWPDNCMPSRLNYLGGFQKNVGCACGGYILQLGRQIYRQA
jgi:hypothetical protein